MQLGVCINFVFRNTAWRISHVLTNYSKYRIGKFLRSFGNPERPRGIAARIDLDNLGA